MKRAIKMSLLGLLAMGLLASCKKEEEPFVPQEPELQADYTETAFGMNLEMVYVKGGEFTMGYTEDQGWTIPDSLRDLVRKKYIRKTKLDSYHIGKYEVTQAQWEKVMGTTLKEQWALITYGGSIEGEGPDYPMYYVDWEDAQEFCKKLSEQTGKKYVLPTDAMWEYAARGGVHKTKTQFAGSNDIEEVAWYEGNSEDVGRTHPDYGTHPVGTKKANALGIYDMSGNVSEWCSDWWGEGYDKNDDYNPQGPAEGFTRVEHGGSWNGSAVYCRVSMKCGSGPITRVTNLGFRVACSVK